jgi:hypothetical protein
MDIFCGYLEHFTEIWDILWQFGNLLTIFDIFPLFWYIVPRKIWQPCCGKYFLEKLHKQHRLLGCGVHIKCYLRINFDKNGVGYISGDVLAISSGHLVSIRNFSNWIFCGSVLPDFSWCVVPKLEKMYQLNTKCTKWSLNIPKCP